MSHFINHVNHKVDAFCVNVKSLANQVDLDKNATFREPWELRLTAERLRKLANECEKTAKKIEAKGQKGNPNYAAS